jgi:hypothetical protein
MFRTMLIWVGWGGLFRGWMRLGRGRPKKRAFPDHPSDGEVSRHDGGIGDDRRLK